MTPAIATLRERLALLHRTFANLDEYARVRLELDDYERAERVAAAVFPPEEATLEPVLLPPRSEPAPRPIHGGGVQLL